MQLKREEIMPKVRKDVQCHDAMFELRRAGLSQLLAGKFAKNLHDLSETKNREQSLVGSWQIAL